MYCDIRLRIINNSQHNIGPGLITLLEEISATGSISKAAAKMGMSLSKANRIVKGIINGCSQPLLITKTGGENGGGTSLTPYAEQLIEAFHHIEEQCYIAANRELDKLSDKF